MLRLVASLVALVGVLGAPSAAAQQPESGTARSGISVAGAVSTACGPAAGAVVTLRGPSGGVATITDMDGRWRAGSLTAGAYDLTAAPPTRAFETVTARVTLTRDRDDLDIVLPFAERPVERVAGDTRVLTALAASRSAYPDGAGTVVVASSGAFPDALAAAPLAAVVDGPLLLVDRRSGPAVLDEVARLGAEEAVIVGAVNGVTAVVQSELAAAGVAVRRIAGEDRFDTAALVARAVGAPDGEVAIATGGVFADALSFAPVAAAHGIPVLLTGPEALPPDTAAALADLGARRTIVLGGTDVVAESVTATLPDPTRVAGDTRYATSVAVAELAVARGADLSTVYAATGADYPDALAAGPVAARTGGPLLLVDGQDPRAATASYAFLAERFDAVDRVVTFGGVLAVDADVATLLGRPGAACEAGT